MCLQRRKPAFRAKTKPFGAATTRLFCSERCWTGCGGTETHSTLPDSHPSSPPAARRDRCLVPRGRGAQGAQQVTGCYRGLAALGKHVCLICTGMAKGTSLTQSSSPCQISHSPSSARGHERGSRAQPGREGGHPAATSRNPFSPSAELLS